MLATAHILALRPLTEAPAAATAGRAGTAEAKSGPSARDDEAAARLLPPLPPLPEHVPEATQRFVHEWLMGIRKRLF